MRSNIFDPDIRQMIKFIERQVKQSSPEKIADRAGNVTGQTIRNWLNYSVVGPNSAKLFAVVRACGGRVRVEA